ncbi:MAG TPA: hypothetical protein VNO14_10490 [Blastocatellia bacterium]|nr:hypothetical protein [Blastocatellia bacterium]
MPELFNSRLLDAVREAAHPLGGAARDYDPLMKLIGSASYVLPGEAPETFPTGF